MSNIYSSLKIFNFPEHLQAFLDGKSLGPLHVRLKPINKCNHNCWYCAYRQQDLVLGENMNISDQLPKERLLSLPQELSDAGVRAVTLSGGGEPLLHPNIEEFIEKLKKTKIALGVITNGTMLKGSLAKSLSSFARWIRISMDGYSDEAYSKIRSIGDGEFSKIMDNIQAFNTIKDQTVLGVNLVVSKENYSHLYDLCQKLKALGTDHVKFSTVIVSNDQEKNNQYHKGIFESVSAEINKCRELESDSFSIIDHYHLSDEFEVKDYKQCSNSFFQTVIGADGVVYSCQDKAYSENGVIGSIMDRTFSEFWSDAATRDRLYAIDPSIHCKHHCISHEKNKIISSFSGLNVLHREFI